MSHLPRRAGRQPWLPLAGRTRFNSRLPVVIEIGSSTILRRSRLAWRFSRRVGGSRLRPEIDHISVVAVGLQSGLNVPGRVVGIADLEITLGQLTADRDTVSSVFFRFLEAFDCRLELSLLTFEKTFEEVYVSQRSKPPLRRVVGAFPPIFPLGSRPY